MGVPELRTCRRFGTGGSLRSKSMSALQTGVSKKIKQVVYVTRWLRPFGLKWKRLLTWGACLRDAGGAPGVRGYLSMAWLGIHSLRPQNARLWRQRLRTCQRCPVYDRELKRCGVAGSGLGCGCFVPYKAFEGTCWLRDQGSAQGWSD
jgi:hypothetical protein